MWTKWLSTYVSQYYHLQTSCINHTHTNVQVNSADIVNEFNSDDDDDVNNGLDDEDENVEDFIDEENDYGLDDEIITGNFKSWLKFLNW